MKYPNNQFRREVRGHGEAVALVIACAACPHEKELDSGKDLHQEVGGGDIPYKLVPPWGWICYGCFSRVRLYP